jgi:hypothetical protein
MEILQQQFPKTAAWIDTLNPFIVIRGEKQVIVKFSDGRESLQLSYDKIKAFERNAEGGGFSWSD